MELKACALHACCPSMREGQKKMIRLEAEVPESAPEVSRVLFAAAVPKATRAQAERDRARIFGKLAVNLCYTTADAGMKSTSMVLPYETELSLPGLRPDMELQVVANVEYTTAEGSGRELDLKCCLDFCILEMSTAKVRAVCDAQPSPLAQPKQSGAIVYYADGGETLWDIAKRFKVGSELLKDADADAVIPREERLIFVRK